MNIVQFPAIVDGVMAKKDSTLSIKIGTNEMPNDDKAILFGYANRQIWVAMGDIPLKESDINIPEVLDETDHKSPSQRLRGVIYILWEQSKDKTNKTFENFYRDYMEKIINNIKEKLI